LGDAACVIEAGGYTFDFTSVEAKQLTFQEREYTYQFTFCQASGHPCGTREQSSLCQSFSQFEYSLGLWSAFTNLTASADGQRLNGTLTGEYCIDRDRVTTISFSCGDRLEFTSMLEKDVCVYEAVITVPRAVCQRTVSCCAPPTYSAKRVEVGGNVASVQQDGITGDWYDSDYEARGSSLLCSTYYNRCFTFTPVACTGALYRPAPTQCFGGAGWSQIAQLPLGGGGAVTQTAWASNSGGNYVVTMPLGSGCVAVSGSAIDTSLAFSLQTDSALWEVPQICLKETKQQM